MIDVREEKNNGLVVVCCSLLRAFSLISSTSYGAHLTCARCVVRRLGEKRISGQTVEAVRHVDEAIIINERKITQTEVQSRNEGVTSFYQD